jgi:hypothetical protein
MAAAVSSSTGIEQLLRSREELAEQVAVLRLGTAAATVKAWRELEAAKPTRTLDAGRAGRPEESLLERFERVTGRPLATACPPRCSCRGAPAAELVGSR